MPLRQLVFHAAKRLAQNPQVQAKAAEVLRTEIAPRAKAAWRASKPRIKAAGEELRDIARETDPLDRPAEFAAKIRDRVTKRRR
jgi:hypothetical protein